MNAKQSLLNFRIVMMVSGCHCRNGLGTCSRSEQTYPQRKELPRRRRSSLSRCQHERMLGTKMLPKLRAGDDLSVGIKFSVSVSSQLAQNMETDLQQILDELGLGDRVRVERS